jgi:hypothetical protein
MISLLTVTITSEKGLSHGDIYSNGDLLGELKSYKLILKNP